MTKRNDRVAPPPGPDEWDVRAGSTEGARGWDEICSQVPGNAGRAWNLLRVTPRAERPESRHHRLKGTLGTSAQGLEVWQYELTGGGRIWYEIDDAKRRVMIIRATLGHPKETE